MIQFDVRIVFKWVETQPPPSNWLGACFGNVANSRTGLFACSTYPNADWRRQVALPLWGFGLLVGPSECLTALFGWPEDVDPPWRCRSILKMSIHPEDVDPPWRCRSTLKISKLNLPHPPIFCFPTELFPHLPPFLALRKTANFTPLETPLWVMKKNGYIGDETLYPSIYMGIINKPS